jgi:Fe-S-cluster containining protein
MSEVSCQNCTAACCKGPEIMEMNAEDAKFMRDGGNLLASIAEPVDYDRHNVLKPIGMDFDRGTAIVADGQEYELLRAGLGRYLLLGECVYLETTPEGLEQCGVYENRPSVCRDFEMGGDKCRNIRVNAGVDEPTEDFPDLWKLLNDLG